MLRFALVSSWKGWKLRLKLLGLTHKVLVHGIRRLPAGTVASLMGLGQFHPVKQWQGCPIPHFMQQGNFQVLNHTFPSILTTADMGKPLSRFPGPPLGTGAALNHPHHSPVSGNSPGLLCKSRVYLYAALSVHEPDLPFLPPPSRSYILGGSFLFHMVSSPPWARDPGRAPGRQLGTEGKQQPPLL